jgi:L-ascorbate metabolism protein UlaG (beta-lactamase superfamily)
MAAVGQGGVARRCHMRFSCLAAGALLMILLAACRRQPAPVITFVDHAAFLFSGAEGVVLLDPGQGMSAAMKQRLRNGHPPFAEIDLILVTHPHSDHFDLPLVDALLQRHPTAVFASTQAAVVALQGQNPEWVDSTRLRSAEPAPGGSLALVLNGVTLEAIDLPHNRPVVNLGYIINLSGRRLLHPGDVAHPDHLANHNLRDAGLDVALIPYPALLPDHLAPGLLAALQQALDRDETALVPMHFTPDGGRDELLSQMLIEEWGSGHVFRAPLEQWQVP